MRKEQEFTINNLLAQVARLEGELEAEIKAREKAEVDFDREACRSTDFEAKNAEMAAALELLVPQCRYCFGTGKVSGEFLGPKDTPCPKCSLARAALSGEGKVWEQVEGFINRFVCERHKGSNQPCDCACGDIDWRTLCNEARAALAAMKGE